MGSTGSVTSTPGVANPTLVASWYRRSAKAAITRAEHVEAAAQPVGHEHVAVRVDEHVVERDRLLSQRRLGDERRDLGGTQRVARLVDP